MPPPVPLHDALMGLGWVLPRYPDAAQAAAWFGARLHLPLIRGAGNAFFFWAGGTVVLEPKSDAAPDRRYGDPESSPCLPVFACTDRAALLARLRAGGVEVVREGETEAGWECAVRDPWGHALLFRDDGARPPPDAFNPGCAPLPPDLRGVAAVARAVADLPSAERFYTRALGGPPTPGPGGRLDWRLPDGVALQLRAGGAREPTPSDRFEVPCAFILRVQDFDRFRTHLVDSGATVVNECIQFGRGALGYVADPEGHLVGFEERYDQDRCGSAATAFAEDLEANRRARAAATEAGHG